MAAHIADLRAGYHSLCTDVFLHQPFCCDRSGRDSPRLCSSGHPDNSNPISINVDPKILIPDLENQIQNTKNNFLFQSMIATGIIILLSSICTWFVTRRALTPPAQIQRQDPPGTGTESV